MEAMRKLGARKHQHRSHMMIISIIFYVIVRDSEALVNKIDVLVNDLVSIHCYTNVPIDIQWHFNSMFKIVYAGRRLRDSYMERFRTEYANGIYGLTISKVKSEDAGWYYCSEEKTGRLISSTYLTVLYSDLVCYSNMHPDGFIGPNTCDLEQENMVFNCVVSLNGNSPHLIWRSLYDNRTLNSSICEDKPNRRNCSLILKSDPIYDGSIFICQTTTSMDSNFNCSTEAIKILYFSSTNETAKKYVVNDHVHCSAKSNLNVKYSWTLKQNNKVAVLSSEQTLLTQKPGIYQCEVNYSIRKNSCSSLVSVMNVSVESTNAGTISGFTILDRIIWIVLVFAAIFIGIFISIRKLIKQKRHKRKRNKLEDVPKDIVLDIEPEDVQKPLILEHNIEIDDSVTTLPRRSCQCVARCLLCSIHLTIGCCLDLCAEEQISQWTSSSINCIPLELIDIIIQKSFAIFIQMKSQPDDGKYQEGFKQLAEVNHCWFKRTTKRRFKNDRWSYLSGIYEKKIFSIFWRKNRQFIEENLIQPRPGAIRLKNQDLLSDIQCALIARKSSTSKKMQSSNKATDLSLILNHKNETNIDLFIDYLRSSGRRWIAKAMRNCGTSVRVENNSRSPIEDKKITRFFEDTGSESLGSMKDRDFVRWIWCKSPDPKELQQSKYLRHPFCHLVEESPQRIKEIKINVDSDQLKKKAGVLPPLFHESLETIHEQGEAVGVTKLGNEFYCLNYDGEMKVFYERFPFVLLRKFQLKEIERAYDIVSCEKQDALYVLGLPRRSHVCVWKIEQNSKKNQSEIKWLELSDDFQPLTLSISKDGQLLMVSRERSHSLRIYGPDAQLRLLISLRQYFQWPLHAVKTSTGNFVILHFSEENEQRMITTLSRDGKTIVHNYQPKNEEQLTFDVGWLSIDSNDRVFVADFYKGRVIVLNPNLRWNQVLFPNNARKDEDSGQKLSYPKRLYYDEAKRQLVVCGNNGVNVHPISF